MYNNINDNANGFYNQNNYQQYGSTMTVKKSGSTKSAIACIITLTGAIIALIGGILTLALSGSAAYSDINTIIDNGKKLATNNYNIDISSDTVKNVIDGTVNFILNAFNWFQSSGFYIMAVIGVIMAVVGIYCILYNKSNNGQFGGFEKITVTAGAIISLVTVTICLTMTWHNNALNNGMKHMVRDVVDYGYDIGKTIYSGTQNEREEIEDILEDLY